MPLAVLRAPYSSKFIWTHCPNCGINFKIALECCGKLLNWRQVCDGRLLGGISPKVIFLSFYSTCDKCNTDRCIREIESKCTVCGFEFRP